MTNKPSDPIDLRERVGVINDPEYGRMEVIEGEHSTAYTNGHFGGWVKQSDGSYVSIDYARSLNRVERRKRGIKLSRPKEES